MLCVKRVRSPPHPQCDMSADTLSHSRSCSGWPGTLRRWSSHSSWRTSCRRNPVRTRSTARSLVPPRRPLGMKWRKQSWQQNRSGCVVIKAPLLPLPYVSGVKSPDPSSSEEARDGTTCLLRRCSYTHTHTHTPWVYLGCFIFILFLSLI